MHVERLARVVERDDAQAGFVIRELHAQVEPWADELEIDTGAAAAP